jgi:predicted acylesterase/phospholipase RssA
MPYHFRNLVFEGGGVKGIAYVGAMEVLGRRGILRDIERVGGTSAGAINATLFALGYSNPQTRRLLAGLDFRNFLDEDWGLVRDSQRLINKYGWYKGDFFRAWIAERVARKLGSADATFADLRAAGRPDLYVYGTNLSTQFGEVFSPEHTPAMRIADAVRISMSIPLFFAAVRIGLTGNNLRGEAGRARKAKRVSRSLNKPGEAVGRMQERGAAPEQIHGRSLDSAAAKSDRARAAALAALNAAATDVYVDGGLLDNYPVKLFDRLHYIAVNDQAAAARRTRYYGPLNSALARKSSRGKTARRKAGKRSVVRSPAYSPYVYNRQTLGLRLDSPQEISAFRDAAPPARREINDFFDYAKALITTVIEAQATQHLHSDDWQRTVYIDTLDVATTDFGLSEKKKQALLDSGRECMNAYFEWFNSADEQPVNRMAADR